ncbi:hypothetical protein CAL7716_070510 [Calothrix sp. PCC 7716]|nr:hypothetical protein CAL7716_070510 [Calothrix sp. PCC 7716]
MTLGTRNNNAYMELLKTFPPRPITSHEEFIATQKVIDSLIDKEDELTSDEQDYLNILGTLVYEYEEKHVEIPDIYGIDFIKALLLDLNLSAKDLIPIFKTESHVSDVLNGKIDLTVKDISKLADFFKISPAAFVKK